MYEGNVSIFWVSGITPAIRQKQLVYFLKRKLEGSTYVKVGTSMGFVYFNEKVSLLSRQLAD